MKNLPPIKGPPAGIVLGHYPQFLRDKLGFFMQCAAEYGPVVKLKMRRSLYLLTHPDDIQHVLVTNPSNYNKTPRLSSKSARRALGEGLLSRSEGSAHLRERRMLQPMFHRKSIEIFATVISRAIEEMLAGWKSGVEIDVAAEMKKLTQRILVRVLFGNDSRDDPASLLKAIAVRRRYYEHMLSSLFPFPGLLAARTAPDYPEAIREIDEVIVRAIRTRREAAMRSDDMISELVHARYDDGTGMTDPQIRHEALTIIDSGYETTSAALAWTLYLLSQHPLAESKLLAELRQVLNERSPSAEDLPLLVYTGMVMAESMRLYPPNWMFSRVARNKDTLPGGATIAGGARLFLCQYVAHRHPEYFPEPERFVPERFETAHSSSLPRFAYFPFGGGQHACIGEPFARMEISLVLATILQRFRLELAPGQSIVPDPGLALQPKNGIRMKPYPLVEPL